MGERSHSLALWVPENRRWLLPLAQRGCGVLSEDRGVNKTVGRRLFLLFPGYARIRLWPESCEILFGDRDWPAPTGSALGEMLFGP